MEDDQRGRQRAANAASSDSFCKSLRKSSTYCRLTSEDVRDLQVVIPNLDQEISESSNTGTPAIDRFKTSQHAPVAISPLDESEQDASDDSRLKQNQTFDAIR